MLKSSAEKGEPAQVKIGAREIERKPRMCSIISAKVQDVSRAT